MSILPQFLRPGDKVALIAPARKITPQVMQFAIEYLMDHELDVIIGNNTYGSNHQFSGTDIERASDFQSALNNPEIKAIFAVRGGYGCLRIIDQLKWEKFKTNPKWIIGFSDLTVFHSHVYNNTNVCTIHAEMPVNFSEHRDSSLTLMHLLKGNTPKYNFSIQNALRPARVTAPVIGGNLSLLYALKGSKSDFDYNGKILFIEDLDEYLYHIDRMLLSLKRAGKFENLAGVIVGAFSQLKDNNIPFGNDDTAIIKDIFSEYNYPVYFNFPAGHTAVNYAFVIGYNATLEPEGYKVKFIQQFAK